MTTEVERTRPEAEASDDRTVEEEAVRQAAEAAAEEQDGPPAEIQEAAEAAEEAPAAELGPDEIVRVMESLLLATPAPLTIESARGATGLEKEKIQLALAVLAERYRAGASGIVLIEVAGAWQLRTAPASAQYVRRLLRVRPQRLTKAALETLALAAYRQPVTRAEIEDVRGVDCGAVIKALLERKLLKILGKKEELGRPLLYGTTREFQEFFGLKNLEQLPTLREFHELSEESRSIVEQELPVPQAPGIDGLSELASKALVDKLAAGAAEDEAALDYLEAAMEEAEARSKLVSVEIAVESEPADAGAGPQAESKPPTPPF
jgi:segregation and condensation protein B